MSNHLLINPTNLFIVTVIAGMAISLAATAGSMWLTRRWGIVDLPEARQMHRMPIPRVGGMVFAAVVLVVAIPAWIVGQSMTDLSGGPALLTSLLCLGAALVLGAVGFIDDVRPIHSKWKLLVLVCAAAAVCSTGVRIDGPVIHGQLDLDLGLSAWPLTMLWIVGITVAVNFIDGLDGLAAGFALIAALTLAVSAMIAGLMIAVIPLALIGALAGFMLFNFHPARVLMGDSGSMLLGFVIAVSAVAMNDWVGTMQAMCMPTLALSVPIIDTGLTFFRRNVVDRRSIFSRDRGHIHHRLIDLGLTQPQTVVLLWGVSVATTLIGGAAVILPGWATLGGLALNVPLLLGTFRFAGSVRTRAMLQAIRRKRFVDREQRRYLRAFEQLQNAFRQAHTFPQWWQLVCQGATSFDFASVDLALTQRDGQTNTMTWRPAEGGITEDEIGIEMLRAHVPVRQRRESTDGEPPLHAAVSIPATHSLESAGKRLALFSRLMSEHSIADIPSQPERTTIPCRARQRTRAHADDPEQVHAEAQVQTPSHRPHISDTSDTSDTSETQTPHDPTAMDHEQPSHATDRASGPIMPPTEPDPEEHTAPAHRQAVALASLQPPSNGTGQPHVNGNRSHGQTKDFPKPDSDPSTIDTLRVAVVHDFLYTYSGAERVLEQILTLYPHSDLFSLFDFLHESDRAFIQNKTVHTSFLQKMPWAEKKHRGYLPLMPLAVEQLDVSQYDLILTSSYLAAKGVITGPDQLHLCYCHTPVRYAWDLQHQYLAQSRIGLGPRGLLTRAVLHYIRNWDARSALGVDTFLANSRFVSNRIAKCYRRRAKVIYPPVDTEGFTPAEAERADYYVVASRMVPYKRMDMIVEAFTRMPERKLIVLGTGPDYHKIQEQAGPNVELLGHADIDTLRHYLQHARAFVFAAAEDFGIVPVEAMACGTPVIAYAAGGATESVIDGVTGLLYPYQNPGSLCDAVERFENRIDTFDPVRIRRHAEGFSAARFRTEFHDMVQERWAEFTAHQPALEYQNETHIS